MNIQQMILMTVLLSTVVAKAGLPIVITAGGAAEQSTTDGSVDCEAKMTALSVATLGGLARQRMEHNATDQCARLNGKLGEVLNYKKSKYCRRYGTIEGVSVSAKYECILPSECKN